MKKRFALILSTVVVVALFAVPMALAQTTPAIPVDNYGDTLLDGLVSALGDVLPWAAVITAFAIGVGMIRRWLGHRRASQV